MMAAEPRVLCIVDRRKAARDVAKLLPGTFHLSALMCPQHRSEVLGRIRVRLSDPVAEVRVVATQLVEAGVDLDFPVVFRAAAGLTRSPRRLDGATARAVSGWPRGGVPCSAGATGRCAAAGGAHWHDDAAARRRRSSDAGAIRTVLCRPLLEPGRQAGQQAARFRTRPLARAPRYEFRVPHRRRVVQDHPDEQVPVIVPWGDAMRLAREIERLGHT